MTTAAPSAARAFCGPRLLTSDGRTVVDAAHRGRFGPYRSLEHQPRRRPLCHWSFDQGLLGVSSKYLMLLPGELHSAHKPSFSAQQQALRA
jgi:hypothetical protein